MQDIHSLTNGGRLFNPGGGDRRLRPHHHQNHQALKCPRCDSLNTKFCYYNNYNLSQPRHFCKNCRRYWTKGGVLRNVPVGGGCRKTKRSKPKQNTTSTTENTAVTATTTAIGNTAAAAGNILQQSQQREEAEGKPSNSHSSSESSSLTANNTTVVSNTGNLEVLSAHSSSSASNVNNNTNHTVLNGMGESKLFVHANNFENSGLLEQSSGADCGGIFSEIGTFTSLMSSSNDHMQHGFGNMMNYHQNLEQVQQNQNLMQQQQDMKNMHDMGTGVGLIDQTAHVEFSRSGNGFGALDWQVGGGGNDHQSLFDLTNGVDQNSYWNQSQWTTDHDQDQPGLYLP